MGIGDKDIYKINLKLNLKQMDKVGAWDRLVERQTHQNEVYSFLILNFSGNVGGLMDSCHDT